MRQIQKSLLLSVLVTTLFIGCGDFGNEGKNSALNFNDVKIVSVSPQPLMEINASTNQNILASSINAGLAPTDPKYKTAFGIKSYKIIYTTTNDSGSDINASGLVTVPVPTKAFLDYLSSIDKTYSMSIISDQHGTIFKDTDAPTTSLGGLGVFMQTIMQGGQPQSTPIPFLMSAVGGFITVQPDYIGYGESKGFHPYLLEKSSANAVIDLIKSTVKFANDANLPFNGQVFLSGYSEGGYATMAAAKEIEANHPLINLMGVAPMAGPYDLNATAMGLLAPTQTEIDRPDFIGGIINSYATVYDLNLTDIINEPYATTLATLYDGDNSGEEIRVQLTNTLNDFFKLPYRMDFLTNENNSLKQAFVENTPLDWAPKTKMKLLHCQNDEVISSQLSQIAYSKLTANGSSSVELQLLTTVQDGTLPSVHVVCATQTYPIAVEWFGKIRTGEIK